MVFNDAQNRLPLSEARVGRAYEFVGCEAGRQLKEKVYSMGLNSGARLKITNNSGHGPVGLEVRQTRLGIGRGMAARIWVREVEP
jgi:Fe2+ transport system protein FeoA